MAKCWCGRGHPRGDHRNGEVNHSAVNWKLYALLKDAQAQKAKKG